MTTFLWDDSHWGDPPAARDGIDGYTHKAAEGHHFYRDSEHKAALNAARSLGIPVLGSYFVQHPGTVADQVDWWVSIVNAEVPWWKQVPWIWQIDAERFSYMSRAPNLSEINAFGDLLRSRTGARASSVIVYAPKWLYGDALRGLKYELWASSYGSNPAVPYRQAYPGDTSSRWVAYSGQAPVLLQYGSRTIIAGQTTCDANAYRGTLAQLKTKLTGSISTDPVSLPIGDDDVSAAEVWGYPISSPGLGVVDESAADWLKKAREARDLAGRALTEVDGVKEALAELLARPPVQAAPLDPAVVDAAVTKALSNPQVLAAVVKAINDDHARRLAA